MAAVKPHESGLLDLSSLHPTRTLFVVRRQSECGNEAAPIVQRNSACLILLALGPNQVPSMLHSSCERMLPLPWGPVP